MCGIFGYSTLTETEPMFVKPLMAFLAHQNMTRGKDSTGLGIINRENGRDVFLNLRKTKDAEDYFALPFVRAKINENVSKRTRIVLGHTRQATTGAVTPTNAMPFIYENIVGIHNGIISNFDVLQKKYGFQCHTQCDSEVIFQLMNMSEHQTNRLKLLEELTGSFAIAFFDFRQPDKLFFARGWNPLTVMIDKDKNFVIWSSEPKPLKHAINIFGLEMEDLDMKDDSFAVLDSTGKFTQTPLPKKYFKQYQYDDGYDHFPGNSCSRGGFKKYVPKTGSLVDEVNEVWFDFCSGCGIERHIKYVAEYNDYLCKECRVDFSKMLGDIAKEGGLKPGAVKDVKDKLDIIESGTTEELINLVTGEQKQLPLLEDGQYGD